MNSIIREMRPEEFPRLEMFLYEAVFQMPGSVPLPRNIVHSPALRPYMEDFGRRPGDISLCAETAGRVIGAAWTRLMQGFGHVDDATPELAMAVLAPWRGQGIGTALLCALTKRLQENGFHALSLSVQKDNPALRLYRRTGFCVVHENKEELVMKLIF